MPDNPPTPAEIAAALDTLRRIPGVGGPSTLDAIARQNHPMWRLGKDLAAWALNPRFMTGATASTVTDDLNEIAARHGLRITAEPALGELVGYTHVTARPHDPGWYIDDAGTWQPNDLDMARESVAGRERVAAVYLLPEGGAR